MNFIERSDKIKELIDRALIEAGNSERIDRQKEISAKNPEQLYFHFNYKSESGDIKGAKRLNNKGKKIMQQPYGFIKTTVEQMIFR